LNYSSSHDIFGYSNSITLKAKSLSNSDIMLTIDVLKLLLFARCRNFSCYDFSDKDQIELKPMPQECFEVY
jgi:hypothetical protein